MAHRRKEERADRRAALAAWIQVEMNRDEKKRSEPFSLEEIVDWLGHGFQQRERGAAPEAPSDPSAEEIMEKARIFMEMFGEQKAAQQNGSTDGE